MPTELHRSWVPEGRIALRFGPAPALPYEISVQRVEVGPATREVAH